MSASVVTASTLGVELLTPEQLCKILDINSTHLEKLRAKAGLPHVRLAPGEYRFHLHDVHNWLAKRTVSRGQAKGDRS